MAIRMITHQPVTSRLAAWRWRVERRQCIGDPGRRPKAKTEVRNVHRSTLGDHAMSLALLFHAMGIACIIVI